jgi:hypothetical protein
VSAFEFEESGAKITDLAVKKRSYEEFCTKVAVRRREAEGKS